MDVLKEFDINFGSLKTGLHRFDYDIDSSFFDSYEYSLVRQAELHVLLIIDKQRENFLIFDFDLEGNFDLECDRCLDMFTFPVEKKYQVILKLDATDPDTEDDDIIVLPLDAYEFNIGKLIYEFVNLQVPMKRSCDTVGKPCNPAMLSMISNFGSTTEEVTLEDYESEDDPEQSPLQKPPKDHPTDPRWDELRKLGEN